MTPTGEAGGTAQRAGSIARLFSLLCSVALSLSLSRSRDASVFFYSCLIVVPDRLLHLLPISQFISRRCNSSHTLADVAANGLEGHHPSGASGKCPPNLACIGEGSVVEGTCGPLLPVWCASLFIVTVRMHLYWLVFIRQSYT